jgi:hypothetical protein
MQNGTKRSLRTGQNRSRPDWSSFRGPTSRRSPANDLGNAKRNHDRFQADEGADGLEILGSALANAPSTRDTEQWRRSY